ncbi:hypothetical protein CRENBAI_000759 [Crenichthys baileyi]|uniref:Uncharacterized protein n=1 Tax=Crenichthys baileyi TaxID=28760 RepID=A0AAV9RT26_9TELE
MQKNQILLQLSGRHLEVSGQNWHLEFIHLKKISVSSEESWCLSIMLPSLCFAVGMMFFSCAGLFLGQSYRLELRPKIWFGFTRPEDIFSQVLRRFWTRPDVWVSVWQLFYFVQAHGDQNRRLSDVEPNQNLADSPSALLPVSWKPPLAVLVIDDWFHCTMIHRKSC